MYFPIFLLNLLINLFWWTPLGRWTGTPPMVGVTQCPVAFQWLADKDQNRAMGLPSGGGLVDKLAGFAARSGWWSGPPFAQMEIVVNFF